MHRMGVDGLLAPLGALAVGLVLYAAVRYGPSSTRFGS